MKSNKSKIQCVLKDQFNLTNVPAKSIKVKDETLLSAYEVSIDPEEFNSSILLTLVKELAKVLLLELFSWAYNKVSNKFDLTFYLSRQIEINDDLKMNGVEINDFNTELLRASTRRLSLSNYQLSVLTGLSTGTVSLHMRGKRLMEYKHKISYLTGLRRFIETGRVQNEIGKHYKKK